MYSGRVTQEAKHYIFVFISLCIWVCIEGNRKGGRGVGSEKIGMFRRYKEAM